jgi:aminoglycoside phosphotransferase
MDHQKLSGFVDLANVNVMDRYQDIALCYRSLIHNYCNKYRKNHLLEVYFRYFFNKLGVKPDYEKIKYYLLLDELF